MLEQKRTEVSKPVVGEDVRPDGLVRDRGLRDHPETLLGVVDDGDGFAAHRGDGPVFAEEVERVIGVEFALVVKGQVEVQQGHERKGAVLVAFFLEGQVPGGVRRQAGGATNLVLIMPRDLALQEGVGVFVVGDTFISQEGDEALLEGVEAAFDFAFGLGVRGDAMGDAQGGEGALELGVGVEAVGRGAVAKEREAVGVERGWRAVLFEGGAQMAEVAPGGVAGGEGGGEDFAGMIVEGEDQGRIGVGGPPGMGRGVVLPAFTPGGALPAPPGFGAAFGRGASLRKVLADIGGDGSTGAWEVEPAGQFVGQQGEVEGLTVGQEVREEGVGGGGPLGVVIATRELEGEGFFVGEPLMAQFVAARATEPQALGGGGGIQLAGIEGGEDFLDVEG